jgi:UDP-3-O-[3-hydroxymyristoyl] glucosamine N-acyltransferase
MPQPATFTLQHLAAFLEGTLQDPEASSLRIAHVTNLEVSAPDSIAFVEGEQYLEAATGSTAVAFVTPPGVEVPGRPSIYVRNPRLAFARLLSLFYPPRTAEPGIHPSAVIAPSATIDASASIGPGCVIGSKVVIGAGAELAARCVIGEHAQLGERVKLSPLVWVGPHVKLGCDLLVHARTQLGTAALASSNRLQAAEEGAPASVGAEQAGPAPWTLVLGNHIEIGALCVIEAGTTRPTTVEDGTKIDNLVYVGSGAHVGGKGILVSQALVGAGAHLGRGCFVTAQASVDPGTQLQPVTIVAARSRVAQSSPTPPGVVSGDPARPHKEELRRAAGIGRLVEVNKRLTKLEAEVAHQAGHSLSHET